MDKEDAKIEAKQIIAEQVREGNTSGIFEISGYKIAWNLHIECWED